METYAGRLATFTVSSKKKSASRWPHPLKGFSVTPSSLASAGFYYDPAANSRDSDNVTCVHCAKGLEGWEQGDDALEEHLKRAIDGGSEGDRCPWATIMNERQRNSEEDWQDPHSQKMLNARRGTFGAWWKYDGKKGWKPTSERLALAGFYSNPLPDAQDTCACVYCDVQLDGWSKNDDPDEEHRQRNPDCYFFTSKDKAQGSSKVLQPMPATTRGNARASVASSSGKPTKKATAKAGTSKKQADLQASQSRASVAISDIDENEELAEGTHHDDTSDAESVQVTSGSQGRRTTWAKGKKSAPKAGPVKTKAVRASKAMTTTSGRMGRQASSAPNADAREITDIESNQEEEEEEPPKSALPKAIAGKSSSSRASVKPAQSNGAKTSKSTKKASMSAESVADSAELLSAVMAAGDASEAEAVSVKVQPKAKGGMTRSARSKDLAESQGSGNVRPAAKAKVTKKSKGKSSTSVIEVKEDPELENLLFEPGTSQVIAEAEVEPSKRKSRNGASASTAPVLLLSETDTEAESVMAQEEEEHLPKPKRKAASATRATRTKGKKVSDAPSVAATATSEGVTPPRIVAEKPVAHKASGKNASQSAHAQSESEEEVEGQLSKPRGKVAQVVAPSKVSGPSKASRARGKKASAASSSAANVTSDAISPPRLVSVSAIIKAANRPSQGQQKKSSRDSFRGVKVESEFDELACSENEDAASVTDADLSRLTTSTRQYEGDEDMTQHEEVEDHEDRTESEAASEDVPTPKAKSAARRTGKATSGKSKKAVANTKANSRRTRSQSQSSAASADEAAAELDSAVGDVEPVAVAEETEDEDDDSVLVATSRADASTASTKAAKTNKKSTRKKKSKCRASETANESMVSSAASDADEIDSNSEEAAQATVEAEIEASALDAEDLRDVEEIAEMEVLISPPREADTAPIEELQETIRRPVLVPKAAIVQTAADPVPTPPGRKLKALPKRRSSPQGKTITKTVKTASSLASAHAALDALLAGPIPTFDTPAKPQPSEPLGLGDLDVSQTFTREWFQAQPLTEEEGKMPVKAWMEMIVEREIARFESKAMEMMAENDKRTAETRAELVRMLNETF